MSVAFPTAVVTVASGQTVSNAVDLQKGAVVGLQFGTMTSVAVTFQASSDNVTFVAVKKIDGTDYSIVMASNTYVVVPPADLAGIRYLKVVAGSAEGVDRTIKVIERWV